jgi:hypothetical protein
LIKEDNESDLKDDWKRPLSKPFKHPSNNRPFEPISSQAPVADEAVTDIETGQNCCGQLLQHNLWMGQEAFIQLLFFRRATRIFQSW